MTRPALAFAFALTAVLKLALFAAPLAAQDAPMTQAERDAFRAEVRAYLLDNPEVILEAMEVFEAREAARAAVADEAFVQVNAQALFESPADWVGGNPEGDFTIVEFVDYRCGYCRRAHPDVAELIARDGNIRLIVKEFPILGDQSVLASRFAISTLQNVGPEAYKSVSDALMSLRSNVTEDSLRSLGTALGLDAEAIIAGMNAAEVSNVIRQNRITAQNMQISGTPSFVFDTQMLRGYAPLAEMERIVAEIRATRG